MGRANGRFLWALLALSCRLDAPSPPERDRVRVLIPTTYRAHIEALLSSGVRSFSFTSKDIDWVEMPAYAGRDAVFAPSLAARFEDSDPDADVLFLDLYRLGSFRPSWLTPFSDGAFANIEAEFRTAFLNAARLGSAPAPAADATADAPPQGKIYAVPWSAQANFLYYRKDLVPNAPRSWAELRTACEDIANSGPPRGLRYCLLLTWESLENDLYPALWSLGASGQTLDSEPVVDFATRLSSWFGEELTSGFRVLPAPRQAAEVGRDIQQRYLGGEAVFMITWSNRYHFMLADALAAGRAMPPTGIAWVPPVAKGKTAYSNVGTWGWVVPAARSRATPASAVRHERALRFVEEVSSPEAVRFLVETEGIIPARRDVALPSELDGVLDASVRKAIDGAPPERAAFRDRGADAFTHGFVRDAFRDIALCRTAVSRAIPSALVGDCVRYFEDCVAGDSPSTDCLRKAISRRLRAAQRNVQVVSPPVEPD